MAAIKTFISVGENIHCTRIYKVGGSFVKSGADGFYIEYKSADGPAQLPIPQLFTEKADWENEKVKHCAVAIWQGNYGDDAGKAAGTDYLRSLARRQEAVGANYLDINVDEFSTDVDERIRLMEWTIRTVQDAARIPVSVDSSNQAILRAGLAACDPSRGRPMINSVSLERVEAIAIAAEFNAVVIASAAGETDLPSTTPGRLGNLARLMPLLRDSGLKPAGIHIDPLVFPVSVDPTNSTGFLESTRAIRETYGPEIHIVAGLSNISFGMPNRKLLNQVFTRMACEAGGDGGIVDPFQINLKVLNALDSSSESYELARALLAGEDEYGMNYITASREGKV